MASFFAHPLVPLLLYSLFLTAMHGTTLVAGLSMASLDDLAAVTAAVLLVIWVDADARYRKRIPCFDLGMFAFQFFPLSLIWYCWWSRRWHGLLMLGLLLALLVIPYVVAFCLWAVLHGGRT